MLRCDNPSCSSVSEDGYTWLVGELQYRGTGPEVHLEVCSPKCLRAGLEAAVDRHELDEQAKAEEWHRTREAAILSVQCPTCLAPAGQGCRTGNKNPCQPHSHRRAAGLLKLRSETKEGA